MSMKYKQNLIAVIFYRELDTICEQEIYNNVT